MVKGNIKKEKKNAIGGTWNCSISVAQWVTEVQRWLFSCVCKDVYVNQVLAYSPWPLYEIQCKIAWTLWPNYQLRWKHLFFGMGHALIQPILVWTTAKFVTWLLISSGIRGIIPWRFIQLWNKRNAKRNEIEIPGYSGVQ